MLALKASQTIGAQAGGGASGGVLALGAQSVRTDGHGSGTTVADGVGGAGSLVRQGPALALHYRRRYQPQPAARWEAVARELGYTPPPTLDKRRK